jgi:hypothetical protein
MIHCRFWRRMCPAPSVNSFLGHQPNSMSACCSPGCRAHMAEGTCASAALARGGPSGHLAQQSADNASTPLGRSLAGKMLSKKAVAEEERQRAQSDTVAAAASAQEARFELARRLTEASDTCVTSSGWGRVNIRACSCCAALGVPPRACIRLQPGWRPASWRQPL